MMLRVLLLGYCFVMVFTKVAVAQTQAADSMPAVPVMRQLFHEQLQKSTTQLTDFNIDGFDTLRQMIYRYQVRIERNEQLNNNDKIKFLRGLNDVLNTFYSDVRYGRINKRLLPHLLQSYQQATLLEMQQKSILPEVIAAKREVGNILVKSFSFQANEGLAASKEILLLKECDAFPNRTLTILSQHPQLPFADSLLALAALRDPEALYNYAAAPNALGKRIQQHTNPLVATIAGLATSKSGRQYFCFLDDLYKGKTTIAAIDAIVADSVAYYKLLVKTQIDYADRMRFKDTPLVYKTLENRLRQKAKEVFINEINGLHDADDAIRFKCLQPLTPQELYYLCVLGDEEIYTSSYLGVYKRIFEKLGTTTADSLLMRVRFNHFRKWIRMAAGYNMLDDFLARMEAPNAQLLMKAFVNGLDKGEGFEDAVDVADSYASITNTALQQLMLQRVATNLANAVANNSERARHIYYVLDVLFKSIDPNNNIDVSATLQIPPVFTMPLQRLKNEKGRIVIEQFFYGDKDGFNIFNAFIRNFSTGLWRIQSNDQFVIVQSTSGTPITIVANKPLDETLDLDAKAQAAMHQYLMENNLPPAIVIHRGHSYYLRSTIEQLSATAKLVVLGSCGGYNNLNEVLKITPEAHIIASKQVGTGIINQGMLGVIFETLRQGKDLDWPAMWKDLSRTFSNNEKFDDYVPPHKNLGAIFIMAYQRLLERTD